MLRILESALKHGCTREDISCAVDMAQYWNDLDEDDSDVPKVLIIGPDGAANLLEVIGGESGDDLWVWHALPCRRQYLSPLPKQGRNP